MENVDAEAFSISKLLQGNTYTLDYYQREYEWKKENVIDLIDDLFDEFHQYWQDGKGNGNLPFYFLGSIIVSNEKGKMNLVDGQQRLTSILLILICVARKHEKIKEKVSPLIFKTEENSKRIFPLHEDERADIMNGLYDDGEFDFSDKPNRIKKIGKRFEDISVRLKKVKFEEMDAFVDWLMEYVRIVEIKTGKNSDAKEIFKHANDRGLPLSDADMFKGYILSNIRLEEEKEKLNNLWKDRINIMRKFGNTDNAIRCWLRAVYAKTPNDFKGIGGKFYRWIKSKVKEDDFWLKSEEDFSQFIGQDFEFYSRWYMELNKIAKKYDPNHEAIFWNQLFKCTSQYDVILSSLSPSDDEDIIWRKINVVAAFIDIFITRCLWNGETIADATLRKQMHVIIPSIQGQRLESVLHFLLDKLNKAEYNKVFFASGSGNYLFIPKTKDAPRRILARFSVWLEREYNNDDKNLTHYLKTATKTKDGYDIEHIIPNKFKQYYSNSEFESREEFDQCREAFGALLLIPARLNRSIKDYRYEEKLIHYYGKAPLLARTLYEKLYENDTALKEIISTYQIQFKPHATFLGDDIIQRQQVYASLAKAIWNPKRLETEAKSKN